MLYPSTHNCWNTSFTHSEAIVLYGLPTERQRGKPYRLWALSTSQISENGPVFDSVEFKLKLLHLRHSYGRQLHHIKAISLLQLHDDTVTTTTHVDENIHQLVTTDYPQDQEAAPSTSASSPNTTTRTWYQGQSNAVVTSHHLLVLDEDFQPLRC